MSAPVIVRTLAPAEAEAAVPALALAALVAFSRMYLNKHWLVDVTVGSALGAALALATASAFSQTQMKIATMVWIGYGPFYVADALDLYKKQKLKVSLQVFSDPALIPAAPASWTATCCRSA